MITSLIKKYILPKEVDFIAALNRHADIIKDMTDDLFHCFVQDSSKHCKSLIDNEQKASKIRDYNMRELLSVFITPINKESIYRVIIELDWIAISIHHLLLESKAYNIKMPKDDYEQIISKLRMQSELLSAGFKTLKSSPQNTAKNTKRVRDIYNDIVSIYVQKMANVSRIQYDQKRFVYTQMLLQLKDISKRMRVSANSLEDIIMKMA